MVACLGSPDVLGLWSAALGTPAALGRPLTSRGPERSLATLSECIVNISVQSKQCLCLILPGPPNPALHRGGAVLQQMPPESKKPVWIKIIKEINVTIQR